MLISQDFVPFVAEATAVAGLGWTAEPTDADIFPSDTVTAIHNKFFFKWQEQKCHVLKSEQMRDDNVILWKFRPKYKINTRLRLNN